MKTLVTGGGGFLGSAIVRQLLDRGDCVRTFSRSDYPALRESGVETIRGDVADFDAVSAAVEGCEVIYHVAAKAGVWGRADDYHRANVVGTRNIIDACRQHGVKRLVYTSSPSVVFDGRDQENVDESVPYPNRFLAHYPRTKAEAERMVIDANGDGLVTVSLRPHLIWGPGDPHLAPRVIDRARVGGLRLIGDGLQKVDAVYVENAAAAHVLAADAGDHVGGKAYFVTNGEPIAMRELINDILASAGLPPATRSVPPCIAYSVGAVLECIYAALAVKSEPVMSRFVARQLATAHWYDITAARRDLGYEPIVSMDEGMRRLAESFGK